MLAEAQGNVAVVGDYFDGLHADATRPLVADLQSIGLYRAQLQYLVADLSLDKHILQDVPGKKL